MAPALVSDVGMVAAEGFLDVSPSRGWLSTGISIGREAGDGEGVDRPPAPRSPEKASFTALAAKATEKKDPESPGRDLAMDFEFLRLDDAATMLPADELFADGMLVPLQAVTAPPPPAVELADCSSAPAHVVDLSEDKLQVEREAFVSEPHGVFSSSSAPRCSSRWRELLGLKKAAPDGSTGNPKLNVRTPSPSSSSVASLRSPCARSLKRLLHRNRRSCSIESPASLRLLQDSDSIMGSVSACSRPSLSSSSSDPDHEDLARLSLDSEKPSHTSISLGSSPPGIRLALKPLPRVDLSVATLPHRRPALAASGGAGPGMSGRVGNSATRRVPEDAPPPPSRSASAESPRMNASGKVVFHGLERSSSSPSSFNSGARAKHRVGMERSYSANVVQVSPVLNVPVCSLRGSSSRAGSVFGFGPLFSPSKMSKHASTMSSCSTAVYRRRGSTGRSTSSNR